MPAFARLTDEELKAQLRKLQKHTPGSGRSIQQKELQHDLQVHQIELEMQNRELRDAQLELRTAHDRYADLYDFAPVGYMTLDPRGKILEINLTGAAMLEAERRHIVGQQFAAWLVSAADVSDFFAHLRKSLQPSPRTTAELHLKRRDRKALTVRLESVAGADGCRTVVTDITDLKEREEAERAREVEFAHLARVNALGTMASAIAHEVAQPLSAIVTYATAALLAMQKQPGEMLPITAALERVVALSQHAGEIIHSISDFSRKGDLSCAPLALNRIASDARLLLKTVAQRADVEITLDFAMDLPMVLGNAVQLEQVIVNLLINAIESIESADSAVRRVTLRTARVDDVVQLSVTDTGGGLAPDVAARMFQSFFSTKAKGHGIGLAVCRTIIHSHDGVIWAAPNPEGGAVVAFTLPVSRAASSAGSDERAHGTESIKGGVS